MKQNHPTDTQGLLISCVSVCVCASVCRCVTGLSMEVLWFTMMCSGCFLIVVDVWVSPVRRFCPVQRLLDQPKPPTQIKQITVGKRWEPEDDLLDCGWISPTRAQSLLRCSDCLRFSLFSAFVLWIPPVSLHWLLLVPQIQIWPFLCLVSIVVWMLAGSSIFFPPRWRRRKKNNLQEKNGLF